MSSLSREFLTTIAREKKLSQKQEDVFVELYSGDGNELKVAEKLNISHGALRSRLTGIYGKFSIGGEGPGKFRQLQVLLLEKQQATSGTAPVVSVSSENDRQPNPTEATDNRQPRPTYDFRGAQFAGGFAETVQGKQVGGIINNAATLNFIADDIDALVQDVKQKVQGDIKERCSTMRVLDMTQPIDLGDIYTHVNIFETITGRRRKEIVELLQDHDLESFSRFALGKIQQKRVPGLEALERRSKLMILGKPGAGKTTFLKRLATLCNLDEFQPQRVPVFVTLKAFAEANDRPSLLVYIAQQWTACGLEGTKIAASLMDQGRALVLLDGLDEVRETDHDRVLREIQSFTNQFRTCQFVITCRIAAREYTFEQFTEVEVADFNDAQIAEFVEKWFQAKEDPVKAKTFIENLKDNQPIQELATNPLLLTLLCLVFGEAADFPRNRSELYKEGLDVLLKKWDAKRNIKRDQLYKQLSLKRKEDLLSHIALDMFERGDYFFKQKMVEAQITQYIQNLPDAKTDPETLQLDSEAVLKSIEAQHGLMVERARGIYSFSHLTFQEYFTARRIVDSPAVKALESLQNLASHITDKRWREVFLLTVGMLPDADYLLESMKAQIDSLLAGDAQLQAFLDWGREKSISVDVTYKPAAVRAFYLYLSFSRDYARARALFLAHVRDHARDLAIAIDGARALVRGHASVWSLIYALDRALNHALDRALVHALDRALSLVLDHTHAHALVLARDHAYALARVRDYALDSDPELKQALHTLKERLPDLKDDIDTLKQWWQVNGDAWAEDLRAVMIKYRNIGFDWQFSAEQLDKLSYYYEANQLLVECLNSDCYVTHSVREKIEDTLLLPVTT
ncbi:MAG: NACHT domain-containing NTPase [Cyanobacteria bacterium P01_H01_bin.58]